MTVKGILRGQDDGQDAPRAGKQPTGTARHLRRQRMRYGSTPTGLRCPSSRLRSISGTDGLAGKRPRRCSQSWNWCLGAAGKLARRFSENHLCGAKELFARPRKFFRIPPPLSIETLRKSAVNPGFSARVSFFCPRFRFFTQDRPFCMARELILATIDD